MSAETDVIVALLTPHALTAEPGTDGVTVRAGRGPSARRIVLPGERVRAVAAMSAADQNAWARGLELVLSEPARSDAHTWDFVRCASTLMPQWERPAFAEGARDAGHPAFAVAAPAGLIQVYIIELTQGVRLIDAAQVERWGAHPNRLDRAGLSILYHRTRHHEPAPVEELAGAYRLATGDGHDAARTQLFEIMPPSAPEVMVAVPDQNTVVWVDATDSSAVEALAAWASSRFATTDNALTPSLVRVANGLPVSESAATAP